MHLERLPGAAAWRHVEAREGFEVLFSEARLGGGWVLAGHTTAEQAGEIWWVGYQIDVDARWGTVRARVRGRSPAGARQVVLERLEGDRWTIDGVHVLALDGCVDVDLESSAVTNTLPVHRLDFVPGEEVSCPAAYVRADDLRVERLEQTYTALPDLRFAYEAPAFDFVCELRYDASGLIVDYPGIAHRVR